MATKPTREQQQACDHLAAALLLLTDAARLDPRSRLDAAELAELARRLAAITPAFSQAEILGRALERRCRALDLPGNAAELLTLMDAEISPLEMLRLPDDELRGLVAKLEEELGDV